MRTVADVDAALGRLCARRDFLTHQDFESLTTTLLDARLYLTTKPDTGTDVPTREALDGSPRPSTRPERSPA